MNINFVNDPINCSWVNEFTVTVSEPILFDPFALNVRYSLAYVARPDATLSIASSDTINFSSKDWRAAQTHPIPSNQSTDGFTVTLNHEDLNKFWAVKLSYTQAGANGFPETYEFIRLVYFAQIDVNVEDGGLLFPEQQHSQYENRKEVGVCFSGGGTRSHLLSMGQMRFLHNHGYAENIGYYSSVSGGSWATSIYTFAKENNIESLLGTYSEIDTYPTLINQTSSPSMAAGAQTGKFLQVMVYNLVAAFFHQLMNTQEGRAKVSENFNQEFVNTLSNLVRIPLDRLWIESVGWAFFNPNGLFSVLNAYEESFTLDQASANAIQQGSGSIQQTLQYFYKVNTARENGQYPPYYIANSLMLRPTDGKTGDYIGYEYTPLYQGADFNGVWKTGDTDAVHIGGGNIPMFAYDTEVISKVNDNQVWVMRQSINSLASLATASGTSSSAFAGATSGLPGITWQEIIAEIIDIFSDSPENLASKPSILEEFLTNYLPPSLNSTEDEYYISLKEFIAFLVKPENWKWMISNIGEFIDYLKANASELTPKANYFSPKQAETQKVNTLSNYGDAGLSDNFGLMALLRREVKKVVVFVNTGTEVTLTDDKKLKDMDTSVQAFFGMYEDSGQISGIHLDNLQAFNQSDYKQLEQQIITCLENKETVVATTRHKVLPNKSWDVAGNYDVEIMWYFNCRPEAWEKEVSPAVIQQLDDQGSSKVGQFPFYDTFPVTIFGLNDFEINMMANIAQWNLENTKKQLNEFLN